MTQNKGVVFIAAALLAAGLGSAHAFDPAAVEQLKKTGNCPACDLSSANLENLDLQKANLAGANLKFADLSSANLTGANLKGAQLQDVNVEATNLTDADLSGANLGDTDLTESEVILTGANLSGAKWGKVTCQPGSMGGCNQ